METVRHLHILSSQLIRLRRSLTPLLHVTYIIRDQDIQRTAAATAIASRIQHKSHQHDTAWLSTLTVPGLSRPSSGDATPQSMFDAGGSVLRSQGGTGAVIGYPDQVQQGFFSPLTKVYIGDVVDHIEIIVSSVDQYVATCDHLTDYVFVSRLFGQYSRACC
jgi:hypothetical protein